MWLPRVGSGKNRMYALFPVLVKSLAAHETTELEIATSVKPSEVDESKRTVTVELAGYDLRAAKSVSLACTLTATDPREAKVPPLLPASSQDIPAPVPAQRVLKTVTCRGLTEDGAKPNQMTSIFSTNSTAYVDCLVDLRPGIVIEARFIGEDETFYGSQRHGSSVADRRWVYFYYDTGGRPCRLRAEIYVDGELQSTVHFLVR